MDYPIGVAVKILPAHVHQGETGTIFREVVSDANGVTMASLQYLVRLDSSGRLVLVDWTLLMITDRPTFKE